ncbi:hypothetical protein [Arthrobacter sp. SLBN-112]|uniref:hypothetical protein n=1 Tax=Arthrobacter sp. SLBN-112 TaxID=2768452 RepID=UPI0027B09B04|nr:hypothetical protein [Arthrobacter sp. SLBN-112]MDQ0799373.1 ABC-type spermidine/putrescine transport system permease subunit II [Arthrobacter sp. SLBN-112]
MTAVTGSKRTANGESRQMLTHFLGLMGKSVFTALVLAFFVIPVLWLVFAPFDAHPGLNVKLPEFTFNNFKILFDNPTAIASLGNSLILALGSMVVVLVLGSLASYSLSRVKIPRPRPAALHTAAALVHHHGHSSHGAHVPADGEAGPH